jgi:hypothetical protein
VPARAAATDKTASPYLKATDVLRRVSITLGSKTLIQSRQRAYKNVTELYPLATSA